MKTHPTDLHLEALSLSLEPEHRKVLDHLAGCERCRERTAKLGCPKPGAADMPDMPDYPEGPGDPPDPHAFPFWLALVQERAEAADLLVDLLGQPASHRKGFLRIDPRFRTWGFVELLVARSLEAAVQDTEHAEELGRAALTVSALLDARFYGVEPIEDLRARAWGHIANARRVRSDLDGAEQGFLRAKEHLRRGTQDQIEVAHLLDLEGSLRRAQRQFGEAARLFDKAAVPERRAQAAGRRDAPGLLRSPHPPRSPGGARLPSPGNPVRIRQREARLGGGEPSAPGRARSRWAFRRREMARPLIGYPLP